jgi:uncharacterized membrane protein YfcA
VAVFVAGVTAGFTGFGFNLVAVPLLVLVMSTKDAVAITLLLGMLASGIVAASSSFRNEIEPRLLALLMAGSVPGIVAGTFAFSHAEPRVLRLFIGVIAFASAVFVFAQRLHTRPVRIGESLGVGFVSGSLAATTSTGGPPVVAYVLATTREAARARGTILAQIALVSALTIAGFALHGQLTADQLADAVRLAPAVLAGVALGSYGFRRTDPVVHRRAAYGALLATGISGLVVAIR